MLARLLWLGGLLAAMTASVSADSLGFRDRDELELLGREPVAASIHYAGAADDLVAALRPGAYGRLDEIETLLVRLPADRLLAAADLPAVRQIELIDDSMASRVASLLQAIRNADLQHGALYEFGAVNISLGVPKALLDKDRSGERTVRRALEHLIAHRDVPVVMSVGNDGPSPDTVNPWAMAEGVIAATATDVSGQVLWPGSSRFQPGGLGGRDLFAAHGYLSVGPWASGSPKTAAMIEAERQVNLTELVGRGNEHLYRVDSGTSYAAAEVTRSLCIIHQAVHLLRAQVSATGPLEAFLPPFVRFYIDTGIDASHPMFARRLADRSPVYSGQQIGFTAERRRRLHGLVFQGVEIDIRYGRRLGLAMLKRAATPVPDTTADETGHGFVSRAAVAATLSALTYVDLVTLFSPPADPRVAKWKELAGAVPGPVFTADEIDRFLQYCESYDLILMHRV